MQEGERSIGEEVESESGDTRHDGHLDSELDEPPETAVER